MIQVNPPLILAAALPILLVLVLMLFLRWNVVRAGAVGLGLALIFAWTIFGLGTQTFPGLGPLAATFGTLVEAVFLAFTIWWVILPALFVYHLQRVSGSITVLEHFLTGLSGDPRITVILIAWFFALFMEGAAGFGTPVALATPFLAGLGFPPTMTVIIVILSYAHGVSYGAVGTPIVPLVEASGLSGREIAPAVAQYHALTGWLALLFVMYFLQRAQRKNGQQNQVWSWAILAAVVFLVPFYSIARFVGPELPTFGGALIGAAVFIPVLVRIRKKSSSQPDGSTSERHNGQERIGQLVKAGAPYLILIALVLVTRLVPAATDFTYNVAWSWSLPGGFGGTFRPIYHPGTLLFIAAFAGAAVQRTSREQMRQAAGFTGRQIVMVTLALITMLSLSRVMVHSGMISILASGAAAGSGRFYPLIAPFIGVLGSFVTGSATASNILFGPFQFATAQTLNLPVATLMGVQGFGSAVGNMISPQVIIAGCATIGLKDKEGEIMRATILPCLVYTLLGGILALLFSS